MCIIGIDLGTVCCGYGVVEVRSKKWVYITSGEIRMNRKAPLPERLNVLYNSLKAVFDKYKPSCLCIEKIFYHKSIRSAFTLGSTRGIAMLLAAENAIPVFEYNSTELKMALTGYGRAEKRQVKEMVKRLLNLNPSLSNLSEDITDALALCICHINSSTFKSQIPNIK
jgi:crossover junction endodeoxyribonuclease RuvC